MNMGKHESMLSNVFSSSFLKVNWHINIDRGPPNEAGESFKFNCVVYLLSLPSFCFRHCRFLSPIISFIYLFTRKYTILQKRMSVEQWTFAILKWNTFNQKSSNNAILIFYLNDSQGSSILQLFYITKIFWLILLDTMLILLSLLCPCNTCIICSQMFFCFRFHIFLD